MTAGKHERSLESTPTRRRAEAGTPANTISEGVVASHQQEDITVAEEDGFLTVEEGIVQISKADTVKADSHTRSLIKGLTWRILATATTTLIAWIITGQVESALRIGLFEFFAKLFIYYIHERIWLRIVI